MKGLKKTTMAVALIVLVTIVLTYCTKNNQVVTSGSVNSTTTLTAVKTTTAPVIDGSIDAVWSKAAELNVTAAVPNPGNGTFAGYIGLSYKVTLRALYDASNIYILAQ